MSFNWIKAEDYSFNSFLLMDKWMISNIVNIEHEKYLETLGIALAYNPAVYWYFVNKCPECADRVESIVKNVPNSLTKEEVRKCEIKILDCQDTMIVYLYPEIMEQCPYIRDWNEDKLLSLVDFKDKVVLDIGSGTGRLAFAAAKEAKYVYASEPIGRLREFMNEKIDRLKLKNMFVVSGTIERIPFAENSFDIVMSGHVLGDDYTKEYEEMKRVIKNGGYIIECPGEDDRKKESPSIDMINLGFEYSHYISVTGGDVYRFWKKITK